MNALTRCLAAYWNSSIGKKLIVALTGLFLLLFLAGHLVGNLVVFMGPEPFNSYAYFLHHMAHGAGIWAFRIVMLVMLGAHIIATIALTKQNKAARKSYECNTTIQASTSSRYMILTGLTILAFFVYHMVIDGFSVWYVSAFYILSMTLLASHLVHGFQSVFQTLGLRSKKTAATLQQLSLAYAALIWIGFVSIPVAILLGFGK
jgi:succinate dehydrogenase / fumarate reductase, cytochrome b subunit